jgi:hypothetical protein
MQSKKTFLLGPLDPEDEVTFDPLKCRELHAEQLSIISGRLESAGGTPL